MKKKITFEDVFLEGLLNINALMLGRYIIDTAKKVLRNKETATALTFEFPKIGMKITVTVEKLEGDGDENL